MSGLVVILLGLGLAFGLGWSQLPSAPWGDEAWRRGEAWRQALITVFLPWQPSPLVVGWEAGLARWTLPAALAASALPWVLRRASAAWRRVRVGRKGGHGVVIGASPLALALCRGWAARGREVLALLPSRADVPALQQAGMAYRVAEGESEAACAQARLSTAARVVLLAASDAAALEQSLALATWLGRYRPGSEPPLLLQVLIEDAALRRGLASRLAALAPQAVEVRALGAGQVAVRRLLPAWPTWRHEVAGRSVQDWLLLGWSGASEALLLQAMRLDTWSEPGAVAPRPRFLVVAPEASAALVRLRAQWPGLDAVAEVLALDEDPLHTQAVLAACQARLGWPQQLVCCAGDGLSNLSVAMAYADALRAVPSAPAWPALTLYAEQPQALRVASDLLAGFTSVHTFGGTEALAHELLAGEPLDAMARGQHEAYLKVALGQGQLLGGTRALQAWHHLPEDLRDDNRIAADHLWAKLHFVGWTVLPEGQGPGEPLELDSSTWEALARLEHVRWHVQRQLAGWQWAATRDDARKLHPGMADYDQLSEALKDLDREQVQRLPQLLNAAGIAVARRRCVLVAAVETPWAFTPGFEATCAQLLDAVCGEGVPAAAAELWVVGHSAMAWRAAEIALEAGARVGVVVDKHVADRLAGRGSEDEVQRVRAVLRAASFTLRLPGDGPGDGPVGSADGEQQRLLTVARHLHGACPVFIGLGASAASGLPASAWCMDAQGNWIQRGERA